MSSSNNVIVGEVELTPAEFEIIKLIMQFLLNKEIAAKRGTSVKTIEGQKGTIFKKLHAKHARDVIAWGLKNGFDHQGNYTPKRPEGISAHEILVEGNKQKGIGILP